MTSQDMPMSGKVCMVTGATSGIGLVTARELALLGATVVGVGRNRRKSLAVANDIRQQTGNAEVEYLLADLSAPQEIRQLAEQFRSRYERLDVLVNNAGAVFYRRQGSVCGIEMTFALNHLAYFLLTNLLTDMLKASAPARVINVSSQAHKGAKLNFDDLQFRRRYLGWVAYNRSKLANLLFTYELARRLEGTGVTVNALSPGLVATEFGTEGGGLASWSKRAINAIAGISPEAGAQTSIYLATSPEVEGITGKYFVRQRPAPSSPVSYDQEAARRLWLISAEMTGLVV